MAICKFSVRGEGATRLLSALIGMLSHRRLDVVSINARVHEGRCHAQLCVDVADEATVELLRKRLNRIVGVVSVERLESTLNAVAE